MNSMYRHLRKAFKNQFFSTDFAGIRLLPFAHPAVMASKQAPSLIFRSCLQEHAGIGNTWTQCLCSTETMQYTWSSQRTGPFSLILLYQELALDIGHWTNTIWMLNTKLSGYFPPCLHNVYRQISLNSEMVQSAFFRTDQE